MSKFVISISFSVLLMFSILTPAMVTVFDIEVTAISFADTSEEEQQEKSEKEIKVIDLMSSHFKSGSLSFSDKNAAKQFFYFEDSSNYILEVVIPPPELLG